SNFSKSLTCDSKKIGANKFEITVTPIEGAQEKSFQCENRIGYFEAIAMLFNNKLPKIEHPECIFKGGRVCRYIVSWKKSYSDLWKKITNYIIILSLLTFIGSFFLSPVFSINTVLPLSILVILLLNTYHGSLEKQELNNAINNLRDSSDKLIEQINLNYNHALMINEIGLALNKQMDMDGIFHKIMHILQKRFDYDRGIIYMPNPEKTRLIFRDAYGYTDEQYKVLRNSSFHLDRTESKGVFVVSFKEQRPFLINDINQIQDSLSVHSLEFAKKMGSKSFICCPIIYEDESLGIIAVDNIHTKKPLLQSDINLLMGIAPEIGISIHNIRLLEEKERQFQSLLHVLAASIDARDPLTAGHSEKVTEYALGICHELGMPKQFCEIIRIASLLHDYGKIGIKDSILKKPGRLNLKEYEEIKTHAEKTKTILEQMNFEGIYKPIPEIAASHHEKIDGSGYPMGLKGDDIPLGAKIIAVADFFEAITSKRLYRDALPLELAFQLLKEESSIHFDKKVVEAFLSYYEKSHGRKINGILKAS
ncbi:MAG: HD domain-containing protein, partial [bacterium]|nr:HD domain-containing protein [bacterium]